MDFFTSFYELLKQQPVLTLFLIIGAGYLIGNIRLGSFSLGPVAGVLFAGLFFGYFGFRMSPGAQSVGFALFIFSVGYQAGPRFFDVLRTDGLKYFSLALVIALSGLSLASLGAWWLELDPGVSAGILAGGLTSSPTLAAAQEAIRGGTVSPPEGWTADAVIGNITTGYAITYIFGLAGLIAIVKLMPGVLGIDLKAEAAKLQAEDEKTGASNTIVSSRVYRVSNADFTQRSIGELREQLGDEFAIGRLRRDGDFITVTPDDHLQLDDEVFVYGDVSLFTAEVQSIGEEITAQRHMDDITDNAQVIVTSPEVLGKSLKELNINKKYHVLLTDVRRMRIPIPRDSSMQLRKGDILTVLGTHANIDRLGKDLGQVERDVAETDMITFAFGIAAGVLLGLISIKVGGVSVGLGSAGGLLASGLIIGFLRSVRPTFGRLPDAARWIFMEFGLLIFMAGVGLRAGGDIIATLLSSGPTLIIAGILITTIPVGLGYLFGRKVLKLNPVLLLGAITGSMTSGASLSVVTKEADSSVPALGYTGSYAFANVLLTVAGSIILLF